jgi:hypothetical protein
MTIFALLNPGHYIYIETSIPRQEGDKAVVLSPIYPGGKQYCFKFYYHMFGGNVETLNIYAKIGSGALGAPIWSRTGAQGDKWILGEVTIPRSNSQFQVALEAMAGGGVRGDIAIDDVSLLDGACPAPGSCDFEKDLCTWTNDNADDFDWSRNSGSTGSQGTGPNGDHTLGTAAGHYVYIEASNPQSNGDKARLLSEVFRPTSDNRCLRFWFNMYGANIGALGVLLQVGGAETLLWTYGNPMGQRWIAGSVPIGARTTNHRVRTQTANRRIQMKVPLLSFCVQKSKRRQKRFVSN